MKQVKKYFYYCFKSCIVCVPGLNSNRTEQVCGWHPTPLRLARKWAVGIRLIYLPVISCCAGGRYLTERHSSSSTETRGTGNYVPLQ